MIYKCDLELQRHLDSLYGLPHKWTDDEEVSEIVRDQVWPQFFQTAEGISLKANFELTQDFMDTFAGEFDRRFGVAGKLKGCVQWPGAFFIYRIAEVVGDLIATKHRCLTPINKPASPVAAQPVADSQGLADDPYTDPTTGNILSSAQIRERYAADPAFKARIDQHEAADFIRQFRMMTQAQQASAYAQYSAKQKAIIDADYDRFTALTPKQQAAELENEGSSFTSTATATPAAEPVKVTKVLEKFAEKYKTLSAMDAKHKYNQDKTFHERFDDCVAAGLI